MKLCRFGESGYERPGVLVDNGGGEQRIDVSAFNEDYNETFFGTDGPARLANWLQREKPSCPIVPSSVRTAPPLCRPSKIICVGLNYLEHAKETSSQVPSEPMIFGKATTAICGAYDDIILPRGASKTDWEVELAVVIGKRAQYVAEADALLHVAGYCIMNDVSERAFQKERGGQFIKGKSADTFAPFGPFILTQDELPSTADLKLWLTVNGEERQNGSTRDLIFKVPFLISHISQFMTLLPGDVISTGTPAGVGAGMKPPRFLEGGEVIEYGVESLGVCRNRVVAWAT